MAPERLAAPEITQALEELEDTLRAERRTLEPLQGENAGLRARLERLEAERDQLRGELEGLRRGQATSHPRLPAVLATPFTVRPRSPLLRQLRESAPYLLVLAVPLLYAKNSTAKTIFLLIFGGSMLLRAFHRWRGDSWWDFREAGIEGGGTERGERVPYSSITGVTVDATPAQRRRGVGTVQVMYELQPGRGGERRLTLKDMPEPERLAAWIEAKRSPWPGASG